MSLQKIDKSSDPLAVLKHNNVIIQNITPLVDGGKFPAKRFLNEQVTVSADIFTYGHDDVAAFLLYRPQSETQWHKVSMTLIDNDRWQGHFKIEKEEMYYFTIQAWMDHFKTWVDGLQKKIQALEDVRVDLSIGLHYLEEFTQKHQHPQLIQMFKRNIVAIIFQRRWIKWQKPNCRNA